MDRVKQRDEFIYKIGLLLQPILEVTKNPSAFSEPERARIRAVLDTEQGQFQQDVRRFCNHDGVVYGTEFSAVVFQLNRLNEFVRKVIVKEPERLQPDVELIKTELIEAIKDLPVTDETKFYEANSPFSAYIKIKQLCEAAKSEIVYVDRYVNKSLFHRLLSDITDSVVIKIVTWPRARHKIKDNYDEFLDISRLFSKERKTNYILSENPDVHERWLRIDGILFLLGDSAEHAASNSVFSISKTELSDKSNKVVDNLINNAKELFGPTVTKHP